MHEFNMARLTAGAAAIAIARRRYRSLRIAQVLCRFIELVVRRRRARCQPEGASMNFSLLTCDRNTHLKIVAVALVAAIVIAVGGIHVRVRDADSRTATTTSGMVVKAGKPAVYSTRNDSVVR
jgi:hypothetical protein